MTTRVATKRFGNRVTLLGLEGVRANGLINPLYPTKIADSYLLAAVSILQQWTDDTGAKLKHPRTIISLDDRGLYLDQVADITELADGLAWFLNVFDRAGYATNLSAGIQTACQWWAEDDWNRHLLISETRIIETESRPDGHDNG